MSVKIDKVTIGKGRTIQKGETWQKVYYEVEVDTSELTDSKEVERTKNMAETLVDSWLEKMSPIVDVSNVPNLDIALIQELPWKVKGGKPAGKHGFGYIFCHNDRQLTEGQNQIVENLCSAISTSPDKQVDLGAFIFKFGGENNKLLNRVPKKKEPAK